MSAIVLGPLLVGQTGCVTSSQAASGRATNLSAPVAPVASAAPPAVAPPPASTPTTTAPADDPVPVVYGQAPAVPADANAQVASVAAALKDKNHPERLSPMIAPPPFDKDAYLKDPARYLSVVEPGRVFQPAQPGPNTPRIEAIGATRANVIQGNTVPLQVRAPAGMPVTFTSMDLGCFQENRLTSITVAANEVGVAQATFVATSGTIADVNILAACPVAAGQIAFTVYVTKP